MVPQQEIFNDIEMDKIKDNPISVVENILIIIDQIFEISSETLKKIYEREDALKGSYDEIQLKLEREIKAYIKTEEKLKIKL